MIKQKNAARFDVAFFIDILEIAAFKYFKNSCLRSRKNRKAFDPKNHKYFTVFICKIIKQLVLFMPTYNFSFT